MPSSNQLSTTGTRELSRKLTRRQMYRRRRIIVFGGAALVLATAFYLPLTLLAPIAAASPIQVAYVAPQSAAAPLSLPGAGASGIAAVGYPGLLARGGTSKPVPIASIAKIITALVALEAKPLVAGNGGPKIPFTSKDVAIYSNVLALNGVVAPVPVGRTLSQTDVLRVMLLKSANNYAASLAVWAYGSEQNYLNHARAWLTSHHFDSTTVVDTNGLSPRDTSTPTDLIGIGELAIANPVLASIFSARSFTVPFVGTVTNTNHLLGVEGIDGIKTGTTGQAGACLLFSAKYTLGGRTVVLVGVVLGGLNHATIDVQIRKLVGQVRAGFHEVTLASAGQSFATYEAKWGATAKAVAASKSTALVWSNTPIEATVDAKPVSLAEKGDRAGTVTFTIGTATIAVPLTLDRSISDPGGWWRLTHPAALF